MNDFPPMDDIEYVKSFTHALVDSYQLKVDQGRANKYEIAVLKLMTLPEPMVPLVWDENTMMVSVSSFGGSNVRDLIDNIYHDNAPAIVPVVLPIDEWRGIDGKRSAAASLEWFRVHLATRAMGDDDTMGLWRPFTVHCQVAATLSLAPYPLSTSSVDDMAAISHRDLHQRGFFGGGEIESVESEGGSIESLFSSISEYLSQEGGK